MVFGFGSDVGSKAIEKLVEKPIRTIHTFQTSNSVNIPTNYQASTHHHFTFDVTERVIILAAVIALVPLMYDDQVFSFYRFDISIWRLLIIGIFVLLTWLAWKLDKKCIAFIVFIVLVVICYYIYSQNRQKYENIQIIQNLKQKMMNQRKQELLKKSNDELQKQLKKIQVIDKIIKLEKYQSK